MEKYSRGRRGAPAKGVGRATGARVQIPLSPFSSQCQKQKCPADTSVFLLYRKFLKTLEVVYNRLEIKNDITKERRGLRHDVAYEIFCFDSGGTALSDDGETKLREWN